MEEIHLNDNRSSITITIGEKTCKIIPSFSVEDMTLLSTYDFSSDSVDYRFIIVQMITSRTKDVFIVDEINTLPDSIIEQYIDISIINDNELCNIYSALTQTNKAERYIRALLKYTNQLSLRVGSAMVNTLKPALERISVTAKSGLAQALKEWSEGLSWFSDFSKQIIEAYNSIRPTLVELAKSSIRASKVFSTADELSKKQFVLICLLPRDYINSERDVDSLIDHYLTTDEVFDQTVSNCNLSDNIVFNQSIEAVKNGHYNLAMVGLIAVLDKTLAEYSGQINNPRLKPRYQAIIQKVEDRGDHFIDDIDGKDYLLLITYPEALSSFVDNSDFSKDEPHILNRHWIMHGRTQKEYTKLDCHKILNMIYGTIRLGELAKDDK